MNHEKRRYLHLLGCLALCALAACGGDEPSEAAVDAGQPDASIEPDAGADAGDAGLAAVTPETVLEWVDPFIGTTGPGFSYAGMTPAAQAPLGMVRVGPDTTQGGFHSSSVGHFSGFNGEDEHVRGFSHLHFVGTGVADYGNVRFLPATRENVERRYRNWYAVFEEQEASPGWYRARLSEPDVEVEIAAGVRAAMHRYQFEGDGPHHVVMDPSSSVTDSGVVAANWRLDGTEWTAEVTYRGDYVGRGRPFPLWVAVSLSEEPSRVETWDPVFESWSETPINSDSGEQTAALLTFDAPEVELRVGISFQDMNQARRNRDAETSQGFAALRQSTEEEWREYLSRVLVEGGTEDERTVFYTALYNSFRMPTRWDENGRYRSFDGTVNDLPAGHDRYLTDLSLWDSYRTLHPLWTLVAPQAQRDALKSLLRISEDGGYIPRWPAAMSYTGGMEGEPAAILFGESALKGLDGVDYQAAYDALSAVADQSPPEGAAYSARSGIERYIEVGWIPADEFGRSASNTLEWALADHALGGLAETLGATEDAARYRARGESWRAIYREDEGFFWPRNADGSWGEFGSVSSYNDRGGIFVEGSAWHYRFYVLNDPEGLAELMGAEALAERLEEFFVKSRLFSGRRIDLLLPDPYYWHTNQPSLHSVINFAAADRLDQLSFWTRQIQTTAYTAAADGLVGNDDGGTLSAWYVFSALGIYPIVATDRYAVMPPVFERATVRLEDGSELIVEAPGASPQVGMIDSIELDGRAVGPLELRHSDLVGGATLSFGLSQF